MPAPCLDSAKIWTETVFVPKAPFSRKLWSRWIETIGDPAVGAGLNLVGLPGRMRLPPDWRAVGRLEDEHLFYLLLEGSFRGEIDGKPAEISTGDLLWIGPGVDFRCVRPGDAPLVMLRARLRLTRGGRPVPAPGSWRIFAGAHAAVAWLEPLIGEAGAPAAWGRERIRGLLLVLFTELARLDLAEETPSGRLTPAQKAALIWHVASNPADRPTPAELAGVAGLSADYFARCFRRTFGQSPRRWLMEQRIRHAAQHLAESERRVGEVAREFGYADVFLFSRQFKAVTGRSPLRYRRASGGGLARAEE
ncbi:MAG: putative AraC family transcriptional regulator [Rariglobus sp.]|nr:putative AraC family transcriptional regulator [Rariglobus sp.]